MNIVQLQNDLKRVPDETLIHYVQNGNPQVPAYLALSELSRRKEMKQEYQARAATQPKRTIAENLVAESKPRLAGLEELLGKQRTAEAPSEGVAGLPMREDMLAEKNFAAGGIVAFEDGGDVRHYDGTQGSYVLPADYDPGIEYQKYLESIANIPSYVPGEQFPGEAALKAKRAIQATTATPYDPAIKYYESLPRPVIGPTPVSQTPLGILQAKKAEWFKNASPMQKDMSTVEAKTKKEDALKEAQKQIDEDAKKAAPKEGAGIDALIPKKLSVQEAADMKKEALKEMGVDPEFYSKQAKQNAEERKALEGDKDFAKWMAITRAGLGMAGGKSQFATQNIAEGATAGLQQYAGDIKDIKKSDDLLKAADRKLQEAQYLQQRGDAEGAIKAIQERDKLIADYQHYKMVADATIQAAKVSLQGKTEADLAGIYKEGVKSGEIDPKKVSWATFKAQNMGGGVDHTNWGFQELKK